MAKVWFVNRLGSHWGAPGGVPAYDLPLEQLIFKLDLGPQRRLDESFVPTPEAGALPADLSTVKKVFVQVGPDDIERKLFSDFKPGWYDSPYSPTEIARRLGGHPGATKSAA